MIWYILLGGFGIYILFLEYISGTLTRDYTNEKYLVLMIIAALVSVVIMLLGIYFSKNLITNVKREIFADITLGICFIILGFLISPWAFLLLLILIYKNRNLLFFKSNISKEILVAFVILIGFIVPSPGISTLIASSRISNLNNTSIVTAKNIANSFGRSTADYSIGDWVSALNFNPDVSFYIGKEVDVTGFVFQPEVLTGDLFLVSRFVIRCCAADASPIGLIVEYPAWQNSFPQNSWVRVKGVFKAQNINGIDNVYIQVKEIFSIPKPDNIYVY